MSLIERDRLAAQRYFRLRSRKEARPHVARSWAALANTYSIAGDCDDGQTIREIRRRRALRARAQQEQTI